MPLTRVGEKHFSVINHYVLRIDGMDKIAGRARYAVDMHVEGILYAGVLRSSYSSARVVPVDVTKAKEISGVEVVVTCFDMPRTKSWAEYMYLTDMIRYPGSCAAMIVAQSKELAGEALEATHVEYEEFPSVYAIEEALGEGAFVVHEKHPDSILRESMSHIRKGDPDAASEKVDTVLEREYRTQYIEHSYIEPEARVCYLNPNNGAIIVHSASQNPSFARGYVTDILGVPINQAHIVQGTLGGTFGGKEEGTGLVAGRCAYLCSLTKKPVKFVFSRKDLLPESAKHHSFCLCYKAGLMRGGQTVAQQGEQMDNCGVHNNQAQFTNWRANVHSAGPYEIDNIKTGTYGVLTDNVCSDAMRGYSSPQLIWAQKQSIEELAMVYSMGEPEFRRKNPLHDGILTATGVPMERCMIQEIMDAIIERTGYEEKHTVHLKRPEGSHKHRDIGLIICHKGSGLGAELPDASRCMMICNEDGFVMINSGPAENGQGLETAYAQIAAETLGASYKAVRFFGTDTHSIPDCDMAVTFRGTIMGAQSVRKTGEELKGVMIQNVLELHSPPLEGIERAYGLKKGTLDYNKLTANQAKLLDSQFHLKEYPDVKVPSSNVYNACLWTGRQMVTFEWFKPQDLIQDHEARQGKAFLTFTYGCIVTEMGAGMKTGHVDVLEAIASHDVGAAINPALVKGQIYGSIIIDQGFAVTEDVVTGKRGQETKNFGNYILPTSMDVPEMNINMYENQGPAGTYGARSIGEPTTEGVEAAIANAIFNATGRRVYENPTNLEAVLLRHKLQ